MVAPIFAVVFCKFAWLPFLFLFPVSSSPFTLSPFHFPLLLSPSPFSAHSYSAANDCLSSSPSHPLFHHSLFQLCAIFALNWSVFACVNVLVLCLLQLFFFILPDCRLFCWCFFLPFGQLCLLIWFSHTNAKQDALTPTYGAIDVAPSCGFSSG